MAAQGDFTAGVFTDAGLSAYRPDVRRPALEALLELVREGKIGSVVVWKLDRLVRTSDEFESILAVCRKATVPIRSVVESVDTSTDVGCALARMLVVFATLEINTKGARTGAGRRSRAEAGAPPQAGVFGLSADCSQIIDNEARLIREAADRVLDGERPWAIAQDWAARDVVNREGRRFSAAMIKWFLTHRAICGDREFKGEVVAQGCWPAIIDPLEAARVRLQLTSLGTRHSRNRPPMLLEGLAVCGSCGDRMGRGGGRSERRDYACFDPMCRAAHISQEKLESWVVGQVLERLGRRDNRKTWNQSQVTPMIRALDRCTDALRAINKAYFVDFTITRPEWLRVRDALALTHAQRVARLGVRRPKGLPKAVSIRRAGDAWDRLDPRTHRELVELEVGLVTVNPTTRDHPSWHPNRVAIAWLLADPVGWTPANPPTRRLEPRLWTHGSAQYPTDAVPSIDELRRRGGPYKKAETARLTGLTASGIRKVTARGLLGVTYSRGRPMYGIEDIDEYLEHYALFAPKRQDAFRAAGIVTSRQRLEARRAERAAFYRTHEVAALLHCGEQHVRVLARRRVLPAVCVARKWRFPKDEIRQWLSRYEVTARGTQLRARPSLTRM